MGGKEGLTKYLGSQALSMRSTGTGRLISLPLSLVAMQIFIPETGVWSVFVLASESKISG